MIVGSACNVGDCHSGTLARRKLSNQPLLGRVWQISALAFAWLG
jgi:hypothetical protein